MEVDLDVHLIYLKLDHLVISDYIHYINPIYPNNEEYL